MKTKKLLIVKSEDENRNFSITLTQRNFKSNEEIIGLMEYLKWDIISGSNKTPQKPYEIKLSYKKENGDEKGNTD